MDTEHASRLQSGEGAALAEQYGQSRIGARLRLGTYLKELWSRRQFIWALSTSNAYARNRDNYLGQLWNILNPLMMWAAVYFFVFGILLGTRRDVMLDEFAVSGTMWLFGVGWGLLFLIGGFLLFSRAEERYGRD